MIFSLIFILHYGNNPTQIQYQLIWNHKLSYIQSIKQITYKLSNQIQSFRRKILNDETTNKVENDEFLFLVR